MVHCELGDDFEVLKSLGTTFELDVEGVGCCCHFVLELLLYKVEALLLLIEYFKPLNPNPNILKICHLEQYATKL